MNRIEPISTFVINLENRNDRKEHILNEFAERDEFKVSIVKADKHNIGAIGLWNTITNIIQNQIDKESNEYVLICEDDHQFTKDYSKEFLFDCITEAKAKDADILLGGVSWFEDALEITKDLFCTPRFSGTQFIFFFKKFFKFILNAQFGNNDMADWKMCELSNKILFIYPFISIQRDFGYSDVTTVNNTKGRVEELFNKSLEVLQLLKTVSFYFKSCQKSSETKNDFETYENISIPTYIINLPGRNERLKHIKKQFARKKEFDVTIVEASTNSSEKLGQWISVLKIVQMAVDNNEEVIIICKDDHEFTEHYSKDYLIKNILEAHQQGADLLLGGVGNFSHAIPVIGLRRNRLAYKIDLYA